MYRGREIYTYILYMVVCEKMSRVLTKVIKYVCKIRCCNNIS